MGGVATGICLARDLPVCGPAGFEVQDDLLGRKPALPKAWTLPCFGLDLRPYHHFRYVETAFSRGKSFVRASLR